MLSPAESDRLCVVLVRTRNPLNIGAAARAMQNFGIRRLRVVQPFDPSFREARSAVGASSLLANAEEFQNMADAVADCSLVVGTAASGTRRADHPVLDLQSGAQVILKKLRRAQQGTGRIAIVFGSEKSGLSNDALSYCHWRMHIPTGAQQPSMNLGQAVAVCLYELARGNPKSKPRELSNSAASEEIERVLDVLLDALTTSGYLKAAPSPEKRNGVRRFLRRLHLNAEDATTLLGMMRQILWKLRRSSN